MARSRRKFPRASVTCQGFRGGENLWKAWCSRVVRRKVKALIRSGEYEVFPLPKEVSDIWWWPKDGSYYFGNSDLTPKIYRQMMAK